jgi:hypothetical protein
LEERLIYFVISSRLQEVDCCCAGQSVCVSTLKTAQRQPTFVDRVGQNVSIGTKVFRRSLRDGCTAATQKNKKITREGSIFRR